MRELGYHLHVMVVDNASTDNTADIARSHGVQVIHEPARGKGNAIRRAFREVPATTDYVVMLDGDATYSSSEILRLIEPIESGFCSVVLGSRLGGKISPGSMNYLNRAGNWLFSFLVRITYQANVTDVLTGYFALSMKAVNDLLPHMTSSGFTLEMEMLTKLARLGHEIYSVPISYRPRAGRSQLRPIRDGARILWTYLKHHSWRPQTRRICFLSDAVYPYHKGGKETRLHEITRRLALNGQEVHVFTMKWWNGPNVLEREGVYFHAICRKYPLYKGDRRSTLQALVFGLAALRLAFVDFDVLDVDNVPFFPLFSAKLVCLAKRKPMYATWHEVWGRDYWQEYLGKGGRFAALIEKTAMRLPDVILSTSSHTTHRLRSEGAKQPIQTIPPGVDRDSILAAPKFSGVNDILYAGRLLKHKNVDLLLKAIALIKSRSPRVVCTIVGDGPERESLVRLATELGVVENVRFQEFYENQSDLYGLMKASRVLVLPSSREGFGLVVAEANACGIPVITLSHRENAARLLIEEGKNGLLVEPDAESLADTLVRILNGEVSMEPTTGGSDSFVAHDWKVVAQNIEAVLGSAAPSVVRTNGRLR
jgi:glycosyltransferase involved in cell wall biosynthesis